MSTETITAISSMATRQVLAELAEAYAKAGGRQVALESVGGVDAAKRVAAGEAFDAVLLGSDALDKLMAGGHLVAGSKIDLVHSPIAVAVREGAARPDIGSEDAVRRSVLGARTVSFSTGPSGVYLAKLFERWGIAEELKPRLVQAPPGVPVGTLVAKGEVELGFQQLSELVGLPGITVLGTLPSEIAYITTFSGAVGARAARPEAARDWLAFIAAPAADETKCRHGMAPTR